MVVACNALVASVRRTTASLEPSVPCTTSLINASEGVKRLRVSCIRHSLINSWCSGASLTDAQQWQFGCFGNDSVCFFLLSSFWFCVYQAVESEGTQEVGSRTDCTCFPPMIYYEYRYASPTRRQDRGGSHIVMTPTLLVLLLVRVSAATGQSWPRVDTFSTSMFPFSSVVIRVKQTHKQANKHK